MKWITKIMRTSYWKWFASHILGKFTLRIMGYPTFPMEDYFIINSIIKEEPDTAYIFLSTDFYNAASLLIRSLSESKFSHAGLIIKTEKECEAIHMTSKGLNYETLLNVLKEVDRFVVLKLKLKSGNDFKTRIQKILDIKHNLFYDYALELESEEDTYKEIQERLRLGKFLKLYCSEFVYLMIQDLVVPPKQIDVSKIYDKNLIEPDDLLNLGEVVYSFNFKGSKSI